MNRKSRIFIACTAVIVTHFVAAMAHAEQTPSPRLTEIRTASSNILVAYFKSPELDAIDTDIDQWRLNGQPPLEISKWVTPKWDRVAFEYEHHTAPSRRKLTLARPRRASRVNHEPPGLRCSSPAHCDASRTATAELGTHPLP
jgi:hypothetical protein